MNNVLYLKNLPEFEGSGSKKRCMDKEGLKREYLESMLLSHKKEYIQNIFYSFDKSYRKEKELNKDIYEFNQREFEQLFYEMDNATISSLNIDLGNISKYIDYCVDKQFVKIGYNLLKTTSTFDSENRVKFLNDYKFVSKFVDSETVDVVLKRSRYPQDKAIVQLVFYEGIRGVGNCELTGLTKKDINVENKTMILKDEKDNFSRIKYVSQDTIDLVLAAGEQKTYVLGNDAYTNDTKKNVAKELHVSEFIFRNANTTKNAKMTNRGIDNRIRRLIQGLEMPIDINVTKLLESGMINKTLKIMEENKIKDIDELKPEHLAEVCIWGGKDVMRYSNKLKINVGQYLKMRPEYERLYR